MSSIDSNAISVPQDPGLQLAPAENEGPNFGLLKKAFEDCVRDNQPYIDQCRLNYETRYAIRRFSEFSVFMSGIGRSA